MYLLAIFPAAVWIGAYAFRRSWVAFLIIFAGLAAALAITNLLGRFTTVQPGDGLSIFHIFAYAYCAVVTLVGVMIACQTRRPRPMACHRCGYDLFGNESGICPECGRLIEAPGPEAALGAYFASAAARRDLSHASAKCRPSTMAAPPRATPTTSNQ